MNERGPIHARELPPNASSVRYYSVVGSGRKQCIAHAWEARATADQSGAAHM